MLNDKLFSDLTAVFRDVFDDDNLTLTPATTAADIEGWDSLNHIRLVLSVEKQFGFSFSAAEIGVLKNVGEFAELIQSRVR